MSALSHRVNDDGDHEIIVVVDGANVPLVRVSADRVRSLAENAINRGDATKAAGPRDEGGGQGERKGRRRVTDGRHSR